MKGQLKWKVVYLFYYCAACVMMPTYKCNKQDISR